MDSLMTNIGKYKWIGILLIGIIVGFCIQTVLYGISLSNLVAGGARDNTMLSVFSLNTNGTYVEGGTAQNSNVVTICKDLNASVLLVSCANPLTPLCSFSCYK